MTKGDYKNAKGVLPWKKGDELSEHIINRFRDGGEDAKPYYYRKWVNAQALADKLLVMLKEIAEVIELWDMGCPICGGWNHRKDCELAEAIAEE